MLSNFERFEVYECEGNPFCYFIHNGKEMVIDQNGELVDFSEEMKKKASPPVPASINSETRNAFMTCAKETYLYLEFKENDNLFAKQQKLFAGAAKNKLRKILNK